MNSNEICLALETAVGNGSIAILKGVNVLAESDGNGLRPARAEELLTAIQELSDRASISTHEFDLLAVSMGPGSYSGIRIGVSTAIGLKNALDIESRGVSLLEAMAYSVGDGSSEIVCAVPVGKNDIAWQRFLGGETALQPLSSPTLVSLVDFMSVLGGLERTRVTAPRLLLDRISSGALDHDLIATDDTASLAALVGIYSVSHTGARQLQPIYLRSGKDF